MPAFVVELVRSLTATGFCFFYHFLPGCAIEFGKPFVPIQELVAGRGDTITAKFQATVIVGLGCYCDNTCSTYDDGSVRGRALQEGRLLMGDVESNPFDYITTSTFVIPDEETGGWGGILGLIRKLIRDIIASLLSLFGF